MSRYLITSAGIRRGKQNRAGDRRQPEDLVSWRGIDAVVCAVLSASVFENAKAEPTIHPLRTADAAVYSRLLSTPRKFCCLCGQDREARPVSDPPCSALRGMIERSSQASHRPR